MKFMKNKLLRKILNALALTAVVSLGSCMQSVYVPVLRPAPVQLGSHINNIAVIDRATPENDTLKAVDVLTGSIPNLNREASQRAVDGFVMTLQNSPRYTVTRTAERLTSPAVRGTWPAPLSWDEVKEMATRYESDAILVLESFDSEFILTDGATSLLPQSKGGGILSRRFYVEGIAGVKLGFRIYDFQNRAIADEFMFNHKSRVQVEGNALQMVAGGLIDHKQAVNDAGYHSGRIYAERISPGWVRLNREFFKKGGRDRDFKIGVRRARVHDWEGAKEAWHKSVTSRRRKTAGRSAYNLALMYEISGQLDIAREWAQHSFTDYRIKKARQYVLQIDRRTRTENITMQQMQE
ncbi:MAG: DUF6340 family protein [Bacteroidales bacterium]